ncbi:hypothetical protein ABIE65_001886 [Constrictibacter sp. MBR-5]|jgi:hypothetical protein|uniref:hypothetical protein n=1 Tax=Constrictibacter sp. MBR-5 TaxID=3156467 RepID=UPI00339807FD
MLTMWRKPTAPFIGGADPIISVVKSSSARKAEADKRLRYYADEQADETINLIRRRFSEGDSFRVFSLNIVKKIVDKLANLYRLPPRRVFDGMDQLAGEDIYRALNADVRLKVAQRRVKLLRSALLHVGWNGTHATLNVVTGNIADVLYEDPENPTRIVITHRRAREEDTTYSDWTATTYHRRDYRGRIISVPGNPDAVNPYGILPFVPLFAAAPDDEFWLPGGRDLIEAQEAINVATANLWRAIELQSHGQAWATKLDPRDVLKTGPNRAIILPDGGEFGYAAPNTPIQQVLAGIEFLIRQTAITNGLSADVFDLDRKSESGAAKKVEQIDLAEARLDDIGLWRTYEARLWEVLKVVVNTHAPGTVPADARMHVDFAEMKEHVSEIDRLTNYRNRLDMGVWSPVDVLMTENPDGFSTREDAMRELLRRREEADQLALTL